MKVVSYGSSANYILLVLLVSFRNLTNVTLVYKADTVLYQQRMFSLRSKQIYNRVNQHHVRLMSIDVHTHMYTPKYMNILKKRTDIPRVITVNNQSRLVILPGEDKEITTSTGCYTFPFLM